MRLFIYISEMLGRAVVDDRNQMVGRLFDISMRLNEEVFPRADQIIVKRGYLSAEYVGIPLDDIAEMGRPIKLKVSLEKLSYQKERVRCDFSLRRDILDQQVVDTDGQKVERVNDAHLLRVDNQIYLAHVDVGLRGIIRRLGWTGLIDGVIRLLVPNSPFLKQEELISWKNTQPLTVGRGVNVLRSDVARNKLAKIPAAELADIMEDLDIFEKMSLFKTFNVDMQRRVFTDMATQDQLELIDQLEDREGGDLLENIPADEATDLLQQLPKERRMQLMRFMHSKTSKELRKLLGFAQDTAGGLMTTEYLSLGQEASVADAMQIIKENADYEGNIFFVYILDDQNRLIGTTSLRRFINSEAETPLIDTCYSKNIYVRTDDGMEEIALLLEKYKFSSIPVLDENDVMQGVITSDDVMEELIALTWRKYKDQI